MSDCGEVWESTAPCFDIICLGERQDKEDEHGKNSNEGMEKNKTPEEKKLIEEFDSGADENMRNSHLIFLPSKESEAEGDI